MISFPSCRFSVWSSGAWRFHYYPLWPSQDPAPWTSSPLRTPLVWTLAPAKGRELCRLALRWASWLTSTPGIINEGLYLKCVSPRLLSQEVVGLVMLLQSLGRPLWSKFGAQLFTFPAAFHVSNKGISQVRKSQDCTKTLKFLHVTVCTTDTFFQDFLYSWCQESPGL